MTRYDCPLIDCDYWEKSYCVGGCRHYEGRGDDATASFYGQGSISPELYWERSGGKFPDEGMVYAEHIYGHWNILTYNDAKLFNTTKSIICILPPLPPGKLYGVTK